jgi:glucan phosphoethanolaminetransferase (alkaline phosphatase superfamily)
MTFREIISRHAITGRTSTLKFNMFIILATILFGIFGLLPAMEYFPISSSIDWIRLILSWLYLVILSGVFIFLFSLSKWVFAFTFPVFFMASGVISFYISKYNIVLNSAVIESALYTNSFEAMSQLSLYMVGYTLLLSAISVFLVIKRFQIKVIAFHWPNIIIAFAGLLIPAVFSRSQVEKALNYSPYSIYYGVKETLLNFGKLSDTRENIDSGSVCNTDSLTVVFVVGEAMRADHVSLNGYNRETFPEMEKQNPVSFPHIYSEWSYTIRSLPHIFTRADSVNHLPATTEKTFISIFNSCGYSSWWLGNQDLNKYLSPLANDCKSKIIFPYSLDFTRYDGRMLPLINKAINSQESKKLIVIHQFGCHWYYRDNCPLEFEKFKPALRSKSFMMRDSLKIRNSYDNVAFYTDHFISEIADMLKDKNAIMIYLSDHGELLGENKKWMHAQQTIYEKNPACMIWFSEKYAKKYPDKVKTAKQNKDKRYRTDFLFHSILDAGDIDAPVKVDRLNIFNKEN